MHTGRYVAPSKPPAKQANTPEINQKSRLQVHVRRSAISISRILAYYKSVWRSNILVLPSYLDQTEVEGSLSNNTEMPLFYSTKSITLKYHHRTTYSRRVAPYALLLPRGTCSSNINIATSPRSRDSPPPSPPPKYDKAKKLIHPSIHPSIIVIRHGVANKTQTY